MKQFAGLRVYHATRLPNLEAVAQRGFVAWDVSALVQMATERFADRVEPIDIGGTGLKATVLDDAGRMLAR